MHVVVTGSTDKAGRYREILPQIRALIADEEDVIANLANVCAVLKETFGWLWVGFYRADSVAGQLVLGPFQGPLACTRIAFGKGVCGTAQAENRTIVVPDVQLFDGHIACSSLAQSEIVVPVRNENGYPAWVLDIDADATAQFDETDAEYLGELAQLLTARHY